MPSPPKSEPCIVIVVTRRGVREVQIHAPTRQAEPEGTRLYERLRAAVARLDRLARGEGR